MAESVTLVTHSMGGRTPPQGVMAVPVAGDCIGGKYVLVRSLGGGMALVFEARHIRLNQRVAIKVLRPDIGDFDLMRARFEREARATARLRSVHAARVIDVDVLPNGLPFIVLEYLEGRDLAEELAASGPLPVPEAVDLVMQVADAMAEAHELGIIHRDLKPANLFICRVGGRRIVKILDFGLSRDACDDAKITMPDAYFGTPAYSAPEQLYDASTADARTDVWALGAVLFELLTGRTPFLGPPTQVIAQVMTSPVPWPLNLRADIPRELGAVMMRALSRSLGDRLQSMRELSQALAPFGPAERAADALADAQRGRGRLGEILVAEGLITVAGLEQALAEQRRTGGLLGRALLGLGLIGRSELLVALAKQQRLETEELAAPPGEVITRRPPPAPADDDEPLAAPPGLRTMWISLAVGLPFALLVAAGFAMAIR